MWPVYVQGQTGSVSWVPAAVENNARWCDLVAHTHGLRGVWGEDAWTCPSRTPPLYPDAVTLRPDVDASELLERLDPSPGCSVKDSFASLDLRPHGFRVLFDAQWITRPMTSHGPSPEGWQRIDDQTAFDRWVDAWAATDAADSSPLRPELLRQPEVALVGLAPDRDGPIRAGFVLTRSAGAVGVSNVFTASGPLDATWAAIPDLAAAIFQGTAALCGYESGPDLALAAGAGFTPIGALRVWIAG